VPVKERLPRAASMYFFTLNNNNKMKTINLIRIGILPILAVLVFACKKDAQTSSGSLSLSGEARTTQLSSQQGPAVDWSIDMQVTKNACNEQIFTLTGLNKTGNAIGANDGTIELTISDANGVVGTPYTGASPLTVTTHLAAGTYSLAAKVSTGGNLRGQSSIPSLTVAACASCPYKGLGELTCADLPADMYIGAVQYNHEQLCELLAYNRGNNGYGALVRLAQAVLVAKVNGFTSANQVVAAAEALIGSLNALDANDQASVPDQYGSTEKGHVQDLVKCNP
jgi:hypothetical protein